MPRRNGQGSRQARRMAAERGRGQRRERRGADAGVSAGEEVHGVRGVSVQVRGRRGGSGQGQGKGKARARAKEPANAQNLFQNLYKKNKKFFIKRLTSKKSGGIILAEIERECQHL